MFVGLLYRQAFGKGNKGVLTRKMLTDILAALLTGLTPSCPRGWPACGRTVAFLGAGPCHSSPARIWIQGGIAMNFTVSHLVWSGKGLLLVVGAAVVGYLVLAKLNPAGLSAPWGLVIGLALGYGIGVAWFAARPRANGSPVERDPERKSAGVKTVYVGNLAFRASETDVRELFTKHGQVHGVKLMTDRVTGRRRGFGFIDMERDDASTAIERLNGTEFHGRVLRVNEANERRTPASNRAPQRRGQGDMRSAPDSGYGNS